MKRIEIIISLVVLGIIAVLMSGCRESDRVSYNISLEADNFNPKMWIPYDVDYVD